MKKREKSFNQQSALRAHPGSSEFAELIRAHYDDICGGDYSES